MITLCSAYPGFQYPVLKSINYILKKLRAIHIVYISRDLRNVHQLHVKLFSRNHDNKYFQLGTKFSCILPPVLLHLVVYVKS